MTLIKFRPSVPNRNVNTGFTRISDILDEFFQIQGFPPVTGTFKPSANIYESAEYYRIELNVPGFDKKDIQVKVEDNILEISGNRKAEAKEGESIQRWEFRNDEFTRSFEIPETVDADKVKAQYAQGILSLELPKKPEAAKKPNRTIHIN